MRGRSSGLVGGASPSSRVDIDRVRLPSMEISERKILDEYISRLVDIVSN